MSDKDLNEKNIEKACNDELNRRAIAKLKDHLFGVTPAKLHTPVLRPHTWVFLRQRDNRKEPVIRLGIVFHTWPSKFNMLRFTVADQRGPVEAQGRFTVLDNGERGLILDRRWCWDTMLHRYKGLSAGNL